MSILRDLQRRCEAAVAVTGRALRRCHIIDVTA
jgi:hypothetical protein